MFFLLLIFFLFFPEVDPAKRICPLEVINKCRQRVEEGPEKDEVVHGRVFGKESSNPVPDECRSILPLPSVLALCGIVF